MRRILRRRPSPAMIVATIALFIAIGGTTYAGITLPANSVGSAQLKRSAVVNSRIFPGAVSNSKMGRGAVTFSKMASNQMTAAKIRNASLLGEDLTNETVTGQQINESTLNITRFAIVDAAGTLAGGSTGVAIASAAGGTVVVNFGTSVAGRPVQATMNGETATGGQILAAVCGGASSSNPNGVACAAAFNSPQYVQVRTFDGTGAPAARAFSLSIPIA
jgi:hypothetical protein